MSEVGTINLFSMLIPQAKANNHKFQILWYIIIPSSLLANCFFLSSNTLDMDEGALSIYCLVWPFRDGLIPLSDKGFYVGWIHALRDELRVLCGILIRKIKADEGFFNFNLKIIIIAILFLKETD